MPFTTATQHLGAHSATIGDKVAELTEAEVITNERNDIDPGVTIAGVMMGSHRIHDFAHQDPTVCFRRTD